MTDTREKLEADVRNVVQQWYDEAKWTHAANNLHENTVIRWLDRQAAITEREQGGWHGDLRAQRDSAIRSAREWRDLATVHVNERDELQAKVDELQEKLRYETIACGKAVRNMQDKVNELTAENERLRNHQEKVECDCDCCKWQEEREELQARLESAHKDWLVDVGEYEQVADGMKKQIAELLEQVDELQSRLEAQERETACQSADYVAEQKRSIELQAQAESLENMASSYERRIEALEAERDELQAQADEKWNMYVATHEKADKLQARLDRSMRKDGEDIDKNAVQKYNLDVQVVAGQKIEYTTELRHRHGATTSVSMAFHLE